MIFILIILKINLKPGDKTGQIICISWSGLGTQACPLNSRRLDRRGPLLVDVNENTPHNWNNRFITQPFSSVHCSMFAD